MREFEFMAPPTAQEKYFQDIGFQASHSPPAKNNTHTQFSITQNPKKGWFSVFFTFAFDNNFVVTGQNLLIQES